MSIESTEDAKSKLLALDGGQELYDFFANAILHERNTGKGLVREAQGKLEPYAEAVQKIGFNPQTMDLSNFITETSQKIDTLEETGKKLTKEQREMQKLQGTVRLPCKMNSPKSKTEASRFKASLQNNRIKDVISSKLKGKLYGAEAHVKAIIADGLAVLDEENKTVSFKNGENLLEIDAGIESYIKAHPEDIINGQRGGAGSSASSNSNGSKALVRSAFDKLTQEERAAFFKDGGTLTD